MEVTWEMRLGRTWASRSDRTSQCCCMLWQQVLNACGHQRLQCAKRRARSKCSTFAKKNGLRSKPACLMVESCTKIQLGSSLHVISAGALSCALALHHLLSAHFSGFERQGHFQELYLSRPIAKSHHSRTKQSSLARSVHFGILAFSPEDQSLALQSCGIRIIGAHQLIHV